MGIGVLREDAPSRRGADGTRTRLVQGRDVRRDAGTAVRNQYFAPGLEKLAQANPRVSNDARAGAGGFEDPRGGREPYRAMESRLMLRTARGVQLNAL